MCCGKWRQYTFVLDVVLAFVQYILLKETNENFSGYYCDFPNVSDISGLISSHQSFINQYISTLRLGFKPNLFIVLFSIIFLLIFITPVICKSNYFPPA